MDTQIIKLPAREETRRKILKKVEVKAIKFVRKFIGVLGKLIN